MRQMKDSGIEWIGQIPEEWKVGRLKNMFILYPYVKTNSVDSNFDVTFLPMENIKKGFYIDNERKFSDYTSSYNIFENDDILLAKVTPCFENGNIAIAKNLKNGIGFGTSEIFVIRSSGTNVKFIFYYLQGEHFRQRAIATMTGAGGLKRISPTFMKNETAVIPPLDEQQRIADYLDAQCARIDKTMELVRQSKEKLRAYKLSLITEAVTKGLDPDVPMKDSGLPWIGEIPAGWEIGKLKKYASTLTPMRDKPEFLDGDIPWIRIEDFSGKYIEKSKEGLGVSRETVKSMNLKIYPIGTILCTSSCDLGKCAITSVELVSNQRFIGIIPNKNCHPDFLYYIIRSSSERLNFLSTGSIQANLSRAAFEHLQLQSPPLPEQQRIAAYLDEKCARIDALLAEKDELLDKLAEYKKSLIFECVTGKREVAA